MSTKRSATEFLEERIGPLTIHNYMEAIRLGDDLSQPVFARKLGISRSHLNDIEKGRKTVSPERASRFAKVLGYSEHQFVRLALQSIVDKSGLKFKVEIKAA